MRCSPLNRALVANEKIAAKTECLGLIVRVLFERFCASNIGFFGFRESRFDLFLFGFSVSEATLFVESQFGGIVFPKGIFGVVSPFSTAF